MKYIIVALISLLAPTHKAFASDYLVNANIGAFKNFSAFDSTFQFDYGGKFAARVMHIEGFSNLWAALAYNHTSSNPVGSITTGVSELMIQPLFTEVGASPFYFAPQLGFSFLTLGSNTTTEFTYGVLGGVMFPINDHWSISPEAHLTRFSNFGESQTALKVLVGANLTF